MGRPVMAGCKRQSGFTLVEILVSLTILGFMMAMVATRMGGIAAEGIDDVTRMNRKLLLEFITVHLQHTGRYPAGMVNIVSVDRNTGVYYKPQTSDQDPETGVEVLSFEMDRKHKLRIHYLDAAEAAELREMGVVRVYNLNSPYDRNVPVPSPTMQPVTAGVAVLMIGGGDTNRNGVIEAGEVDATETDWGEPDLDFRILFGLGTETQLIKDGVLHNASTCPESLTDPINYVWKWYSLVLPRLKATSNRLKADMPLGASAEFNMYAASGGKVSAQLTTVRRAAFDLYASHPKAFFGIMCARGDTLPESEERAWGIDFNGDGDVM